MVNSEFPVCNIVDIVNLVYIMVTFEMPICKIIYFIHPIYNHEIS